MVLNARRLSIYIHCNGINKPFLSHEKHGKKAKQPSKSGVLGAKSDFWGIKKYELASKLERQNGAKRR